MPVSVHTEDNRSPRSELLSPASSDSSTPLRFQQVVPSLQGSRSRSHSQSDSQPQSPVGSRDRERRHRHRKRSTTNLNGNGSPSNGRTNGNSNGHINNASSRSLWRSREQELHQANFSKQDLIRMVISAEREMTKLHSTLTNTLTLLDTESHKAASLERETLSTFTQLTTLRENAESAAERTAQDLRVVQFELEHKTRECERLRRELDVEKDAREEVEREMGKVKDAAWKIRRERMMDRAREEGRREGFEKGFMKAQAENALKMRMRAEAANAAANAIAAPSSNVTSGQQPYQPVASGSAHRSSREGRAPKTESAQLLPQNPPGPEDEESDGEEESPYQELNSVPIVTPPQGTHTFPNGHTIAMRTGYSPTQRPVPRRNSTGVPLEHGPPPSVDRYAVSIPPQHVIEQTSNIIQPPQAEQWVTGAEHSAAHGRTPERPSTLIMNPTFHGGHVGPSSVGHPTGILQTSTSTGVRQSPVNKPRVKFRRPSLAKTKETAASWYRSLSFRRKPKPKVLIDPEAEEDGDEEQRRPSELNPTTPADEGPNSTSGHGHEPSVRSRVSSAGPPPLAVNMRPSSQRYSRTLSVDASSGIRARDYAYPPAPRSNHGSQGKGHNPRAASLESVSTHISTSQFDLLSAPGTTSGGTAYPRGGQAANASVGSLGTASGVVGKAQSVVSGKSAKSQGGIGKKLSMIRENPMSRETTPMRAAHAHQGIPGVSGAPGEPLMPPIRPFAYSDSDRRSTKSAKSTNSRMVAVNPDPESPDWPASGPSNSPAGQLQQQPSDPYTRSPPKDSALLGPHSGLGHELPVIAPLRTKKSGLSTSNVSSDGVPVDTPTPMSKGDRGKGKERAYTTMIGEGGSGNQTSPGIGIAVQTPSTGERHSHLQEQPTQSQDAEFLSPRQSSTSRMSFSRPGTSLATSTTKVAVGGHDHDFTRPGSSSPKLGNYPPRSMSPIPRSTPKIFQAQGGLPDISDVDSVRFEKAGKPKVTVIRRVEGPALFGGNPQYPQGESAAERWTADAGMTPGATLFHPLPSGSLRPVPPDAHAQGRREFLEPGQKLHRADSDTSLRSQGSYGKFDSTSYVDPAFWGAPAPLPVPPGPGGYGRAGSRASTRSAESRGISYVDP